MKKTVILALLITVTMFSADEIESEHVTVKAHNQTVLFPRNITHLSHYMRSICEPNPFEHISNAIDLSFDALPLRDTFDLNIVLALLTQAQATLRANPTSAEGSYVQLASQEPLTSLRDHKKLLRLFIACDFLQINFKNEQYKPRETLPEAIARVIHEQQDPEQIDNESILKSIALNIAQKNPSFLFYFKAARYLDYEVDQLWSYVNAQRFLTDQDVPKHSDFNITFKDVLAHNALNKKLLGNDAYKTLLLTSHHLTSLEGIGNVPAIKNIKTLNLSFNKLRTFPDNIDLPQLEYLHLDHNELTEIPSHLPKTLRVLSVQWNRLIKLPNNLGLPRLQKLYIAKNDPHLIVPAGIHRPNLAISTVAVQIFS